MFRKKICAIILAIATIFTVLCIPVMAEVSGTDAFEVTYKQSEGYTVTFSAAGDKSEANGAVTYKFATGTKVTATIAATTGYSLVSIKANNITFPGVNGQPSYTVPDLEVETSLVITVEKNKTVPISVKENDLFTYTLEGADKDHNAAIGTKVTLKIIPDEGYKVTKILYNGKEVTPGNEYSFTVEEKNEFEVTVSDEITSEQKKLTVPQVTGGTVTSSGTSFKSGSSVTLTLTPNSGYILSSLSINGTDIALSKVSGNKYTFTINEDTVVDAVFVKSITVTVQAGKGGVVSINGKEVSSTSTTKVADGSNVVISVSPSLGYIIDTVKVDSNTITLTNNSYTITSINASKKITVTFKAATGVKQYTITASAGAGGTITPPNATAVEEGKSITYVINPESGKEVDTVNVDGKPVSLNNNTYAFDNVAASHTISVTFKDSGTVVSGNSIGVSDVKWDSDTITIDIKSKSLISSEVFKKISDECRTKTVIFAAETYKWTLPKGASISITSASADVAVQKNNSLYPEASNLVSKKKENAKVVLYSYANGVQFPAGTTLELRLENIFAGTEVEQLIYDANAKALAYPKNALGDKALDVRDVSGDGWIKLDYYNDSNIVLCDVLVKYSKITVTANAGGTITPSGSVKVETGSNAKFRITADSGYEISSLFIDGTEDKDAVGKQSYDKVLEQVSKDQTVTVSFVKSDGSDSDGSSGGSSALVVILIIIAIAAAGGATLFIIKLRQEKY